MNRRTLLAGSVAVAAASTLPRPSLAQGSNRTLRFIPEGNLANADPIWTTTTVARNHGYLIYDTLFGVDANLDPKPQMCSGYELSDDKLTWTFHLRDGLKFHDNAPVRGVDCVASIARWSKRDGFGQRLAAQMDGMAAPDDRSFTIKLRAPFPLMLTALGKAAANVCFIMPERVAKTDAFTQIGDFTGSGPFRFLRDEWTPGSLAAYARFDGYVPRQEAPSFTAGGKMVNFDRVEWNIVADAATSAAAMQTGEADWWQQPIADLLPQLRRARGVKVVPMTRFGSIEILRFNHLHPPFDNVKMRQAVLHVVSQPDYMQAGYGDDTSLYKTGVGVFTPGSPAATTLGLDVLTGSAQLRPSEEARRRIRLQGREGRDPGAHGLPVPGSVLPGDPRPARQDRRGGGLRGDGLGHGGATPGQQGAAGPGWLEYLLHRLGGPECGRPGGPLPHHRQRPERLVRLAHQPPHRAAPHGLVHRPGRGGPEESHGRDPVGCVGRGAVRAAGPILSTGGAAGHRNGCAGQPVPDLLERKEGVAGG